MLVRFGAVVATGCVLLGACSSDDSNPTTTIAASTPAVPATAARPATTRPAPVTTLTTVPLTTPTTTPAPASTVPPTTAAPATTAPPTTVPAAAQLTLRDDGLGASRFGVDADAVIQYVASILGAPTTDSQWVPSFGQFGSCPGTEVRGVTRGDLTLMFGDASWVAEGRRHFFAYGYGPAFGQAIDPPGMRTDAGIGVGATVAQLRAAHPGVAVERGDEVTPPNFGIGETLHGTLSGTSNADTVRAVVGGIGCGE